MGRRSYSGGVMTKLLITGSSGFIGSAVTKYFLYRGYQVIAPVSFAHEGRPTKLPVHDNFSPVFLDLALASPQAIYDSIGDVDYVLNLAAMSHVDDSIINPIPFVKNNINVALNMLEYARLAKPKVFLQFGTDEQMGVPEGNYAHTEWEPALPSNPYAASKCAQEALAISYWRSYGVNMVTTHTMNVWGAHQAVDKFIPKTIRHILSRESVPLHARRVDGKWQSSLRCWVNTVDVAEALEFILSITPAKHLPHAADRPDAYNIIGPEMSVEDVTSRVAEVLEIPANVHYIDAHATRPGHDWVYRLSGEKLKGLGWQTLRTIDSPYFAEVVRGYNR